MTVEFVLSSNDKPANMRSPVFFPSISSVKSSHPIMDYLQVLASMPTQNTQFLVSAFDLARVQSYEPSIRLLRASLEAGTIILMDSGNYESYWRDAQSQWSQQSFHDVLSRFPCTMAFSFDEQNPPEELRQHVDLIVSRWESDCSASCGVNIVPIVHGNAEELPELCAAVAEKSGVEMIAVPERRLGDGVFRRASCVETIRTSLDSLGRRVALHLLGTGNPISIAIYVSKGADSFDGLEWCQTVVDYETALLFHTSQAIFFKGQSEWLDESLPFHAGTLLHNLEFYADWMHRLRNAVDNERISDFCRLNFPERVYVQCAHALGW